MPIRRKIFLLVISVLFICSLIQTLVFLDYFSGDKTRSGAAKFTEMAMLIGTAFRNMHQPEFEKYCGELLKIRHTDEYATTKLFFISISPAASPDSPVLSLLDWDKISVRGENADAAQVISQIKKDYAKRTTLSIIKVRIEGENPVVIEIGLDMIKHYRQKNFIYLLSFGVLLLGLLFGWAGSAYFSKYLSAPLEDLAGKILEVGRGNLDIKANVMSTDEIGILARSFNQMITGLKEKEFYKSTLQRYVSKQVADKILANRDSLVLKGEKRLVTVMFADIRGFTPLSEKLAPEKLVETLNQYFEIIVDVIFRYNGTLDKFIGDAVMAYWGAPISQENDVLNAVCAAQEMRNRLLEFNEKRAKKGLEQISLGIGLNTGEVIAGNIGAVKRLEYTVIGDDVNTAQRIESQSKGMEVLISEKTYEIIRKHLKVEEMEPASLKGKAQPVRIFKVLGIISKTEGSRS
ncbi:MAG: adenylate/guanylate cyclase domain-containing protein [Candidatus Wallbacteria bacterium]|nr:adenylate/guanylate cyclase domain-containing protein [Candidatus Wallbacteria bacterium]